MGVLTVQTLLISIDPDPCQKQGIFEAYESLIFDLHGLPVESTFILDASAIRKTSEVDFTKQFLKLGKELVEAGCIICYS